MKIGLIHTRGIGDVVVAIPIAYWYIRQGHTVYWPIDRRFITHFDERCPEINFLPVEPDNPDSAPNGAKDGSPEYFFNQPVKLLKQQGCERIFPMYHRILNDQNLVPLSQALHFDQMKYALTDVPFAEKWRLARFVKRFPHKEKRLFDEVVTTNGPYGLIHCDASDQSVPEADLQKYCGNVPIIKMGARDGYGVFDWLRVIEKASVIAMIDSVFSNIVEQMNIKTKKLFIIKHSGWQPPVLRQHWTYGWNRPQQAAIPEVDNELRSPEVPGSLDRAASDQAHT